MSRMSSVVLVNTHALSRSSTRYHLGNLLVPRGSGGRKVCVLNKKKNRFDAGRKATRPPRSLSFDWRAATARSAAVPRSACFDREREREKATNRDAACTGRALAARVFFFFFKQPRYFECLIINYCAFDSNPLVVVRTRDHGCLKTNLRFGYRRQVRVSR